MVSLLLGLENLTIIVFDGLLLAVKGNSTVDDRRQLVGILAFVFHVLIDTSVALFSVALVIFHALEQRLVVLLHMGEAGQVIKVLVIGEEALGLWSAVGISSNGLTSTR